MALYWAACALVAWRAGYWAELASPPPARASPPWATLLGVLAAAVPQPFYFRAVGRASATARPARSWPGIALFACANGLLESFAFRAVRDAGAAAARVLAPPGRAPGGTTSFLAGLAALSLYCGLIHALFWERVFPPHLPPPGAASARRDMHAALVLFLPMTAAFAALDLRAMVAAHVFADAAAAAALQLPPPWA